MAAHPITTERITAVTDKFKNLKIGVIGDFAVDAYWHVDMAQATLSREAPLFNHPVTRESYSLGGAANVANNLADLGAKTVFALTLIGEDWRGKKLLDLLKENNVEGSRAIISKDYSTLMYAKVILASDEKSQEDSRIDFISAGEITGEEEGALLTSLEQTLPKLDGLIIADYQPHGVVSRNIREWLNQAASEYQTKVFCVDSRDNIEKFKNMIIKPNILEARTAINHLLKDDSSLSLEEIMQTLNKHAGKPVYLTMGSEGSCVFQDGEMTSIPAVRLSPPIDPVGAGDTFISTLCLSLAAGATPVEAGQIATYASAVILKKLHQTGTASIGEILEVSQRQAAQQE